jgi:hypothetical protein
MPIMSYEGLYEVSSLGNVRSLDGLIFTTTEAVVRSSKLTFTPGPMVHSLTPRLAKNYYFLLPVGAYYSVEAVRCSIFSA